MIELTILGTSSMVPTKERNHSAFLINYKGTYILVDCGEGTQRQLKCAGISANKITKILITHWHGDHVLGLPGLIQTLAGNNYDHTLEIYGPVGTKKRFKHMFLAFEFDQSKIEIKIKEISKGKFFENSEYLLETLPLEHGMACNGYNFIEKDKRRIEIKKAKRFGLKEGPILGKLQDGKSVKINGKTIKPDDVSYKIKGKKISFVLDTLRCKNAYKLSENADVLVCEATYTSDLEEKGKKHFHMSAKEAADIANKSNTKQLILTHMSARYQDITEIENDAKDLFDNVCCAYDFMKIKI